MSMKDKSVKIVDWTGRILVIDDYDSERIDKVLEANKCPCRYEGELYHEMEICPECNDTGYVGDIHAEWIDEENNDLNVYEYINY